MTTVPVIFISIFILLQCALGIALLYRGYTLVLEHIEMVDWKQLPLAVSAQLKAFFALITRRRVLVVLSLVVPGSIPVLLLIAGWRYLRRNEPGEILRSSTRWFKAAIQNIAL